MSKREPREEGRCAGERDGGKERERERERGRCVWSSVERLGTLPTTQPTDHAAALYRLALL